MWVVQLNVRSPGWRPLLPPRTPPPSLPASSSSPLSSLAASLEVLHLRHPETQPFAAAEHFDVNTITVFLLLSNNPNRSNVTQIYCRIDPFPCAAAIASSTSIATPATSSCVSVEPKPALVRIVHRVKSRSSPLREGRV
ncbi:hypothetical protein E2542_SST23226 [Spatholobus suberectus]|nr:hypothetical protein E2542_SST23226 [Spatholobus suberectus]